MKQALAIKHKDELFKTLPVHNNKSRLLHPIVVILTIKIQITFVNLLFGSELICEYLITLCNIACFAIAACKYAVKRFWVASVYLSFILSSV